jgi:hypothetical protein
MQDTFIMEVFTARRFVLVYIQISYHDTNVLVTVSVHECERMNCLFGLEAFEFRTAHRLAYVLHVSPLSLVSTFKLATFLLSTRLPMCLSSVVIIL